MTTKRSLRPRREITGSRPITPDRQDYEAIEREHGRLPEAERYRLAQANKLIRLYEQGKLPLDLMRSMDKIAD